MFRHVTILASTFLIFTINLYSQPITRKVLFLGNSYTYVNDLPHITADFALSMGDSLIYDSNTPGGYTLEQHFADSVSTGKIMAGGWDFVVMQEQSQLPSFDVYFSSGPYNLSHLIRQYNPCARKMFYMTWGRKNGDALNCAVWPPVCTYEGMDSLLRMNYIETAQLNNAQVSPVGAVWRYIRQNYPNIELYQADESHPSTAGSYAAACCFYTALFGNDPTLSTFDYVLNASDAANIRNAAKLIVYDSLQFWNYSIFNLTAGFDYTIGTGINEAIFNNTSANADSYLWNFGDGDTSTSMYTSHNYLSNGTYTITLTASICDLNQIYQAAYQKNITFCSHNPTVYPDSLLLCPASQDTLWTQVYDSYQWLDSQGDSIPNETNQFIIPVGWSTYSVITAQNNCAEISPQVYVDAVGHGMILYWVDTIGHFVSADTVCAGDTLKLILKQNKPGDAGNINYWYKDGVLISSGFNDTLDITSSGIYSISIENPICPGYVIYQSQQVSFTVITCNPGIIENDVQPVMQVYPNPASDLIYVKINSTFIGSDYIIEDVCGKIISSGIFKSNVNEINLNDFSKGIYFLRSKNLSKGAVKLIKE